MNLNPILLIVWAALAACFGALLIYRGQLTRYEDDQLFLNDELHANEQQEQTQIVQKLNKLQPILRILGGAAALTTACVVGIYVYNAWQTIR